MTKKNILTQSRKKKAQALMQGGRLAEARALYEQICALDQRDAEAWFFLGAVNGQLKNFAKASECFRRVAALRPDHALAYYNLGMALRSLGKFEEAVQALREAVRLEPRRTEIQVGLAHTYVDMNKPDGAEICYRALQMVLNMAHHALQPGHDAPYSAPSGGRGAFLSQGAGAQAEFR